MKLFKKILLLNSFTCIIYCENKVNFDKMMIQRLENCTKLNSKTLKQLNTLADKTNMEKKTTTNQDTSALLFKKFPKLKNKIPYTKLGNTPTPVYRCKNIEKKLSVKNFFIKRDDLTGKNIKSGRLFGGNKIRKLEFLLAQALENNSKSVITFGAAGSNHALATATYCNDLKLKCYTVLKPQHNSRVVRRNLMLHLDTKSKMYHCPTDEIHQVITSAICFKNKLKTGSYPYVIPVGGSCTEGVLGFVNAAFELKEQINKGMMPEPDKIYIALGSCGSAAGLILGARAAGLKSKIITIAISPEKSINSLKNKILKLIQDTNKYLNEKDNTFKMFKFKPNDINVITEFSGKEYGLFTTKSQEAIEFLSSTESIKLDGTYTGKAFAGLLEDIKSSKRNNETTLFWNTFCADSFTKKIKQLDYKKLPLSFHKYFTEDVQALDAKKTA